MVIPVVKLKSNATQLQSNYNRITTGLQPDYNRITAVRAVALFLAFFIVDFSFSQDTLLPKKKSKQEISLLFDGMFNSNAVNNDFINAFYTGKFIDDDLKTQVSDVLAARNRLGANMRTGFTYSIQPSDPRSHRFSFSFFDRRHFNLSFADDLFDVVFYGNKMFAGDTAELGNFRMNALSYQQFRFGWEKEGDMHHGSYGFAFSLLSGENNLYLNGCTDGLYTAADGSHLSLPLQLQADITDTSKTGWFAQNGMGLSTDLFYEMPYMAGKKPGRITFALTDLGFIRWSKNSLHYEIDSAYYFDGVTVDDLMNIDSNAFSPTNTEDILDRNSDVNSWFYVTRIPCTLDIHTNTQYGRQFAVEKGFNYFFNTSASPYFYLKFHFTLGRKRNIRFSYTTGYGGYGRFHSGAEANIAVTSKCSVHVLDDYLFSGIAQISYGKGLFLKLIRKF